MVFLEKQIIIDNLSVCYYQSGNFDPKKTTVFLHGWNSEARHLKSIFENLESFVAFDLPGFGKSDCPDVPWGVAEYADFLQNFLEKLEINNPIMVGHSFGGNILIKYLSSGEKVRKMIIISGAGIRKTGLKIVAYKIIAKIFGPLLKLPGISIFRNTIRTKIYKAIDSEDYMESGEMEEIYKKIIREDLSEGMKRIKTKTTLIWGSDDKATPVWQGEKMHEFISGSKLFIISHAGHFSFLDRPDEFNKIFLSEIDVS